MSSAVRSSPLALTVLGMLHTHPLHPYGIQRLIRQWGKDQVVNVGQRTSLYRAIDRLHEAGLVAVRETERDQQYPERTVYEITDAGRAVTREWLAEMLAVPKSEFPEFPAALSHIMMMSPQEALPLLERRETALTAIRQGLEAGTAAAKDLPRVVTLESEYLLATATAQLDWIRSVIEDLRKGTLSWSEDELRPLADESVAQSGAVEPVDGGDPVGGGADRHRGADSPPATPSDGALAADRPSRTVLRIITGCLRVPGR